WHEVSATLGMETGVRRLLSHYLAGQFVGNFLPTTIGSDVLRVSRLGRDTLDRPNAFASVIIERLTGWVVLPLFTLVALGTSRDLLGEPGGRVALAIALATLVVLFCIVYLAEHDKVGGKVVGDSGLRQRLGAVHTGLTTYRQHRIAATRLLVVAVAYQLLLVTATGLAAAAIGIRPGVMAWLAFAPMVLIVQVLPVSIGGLGIREGALIVFLGDHGVSDGQAVSLGLVLYVLNLLVSLLGAPSFAIGSHNSTSTADVPAEGLHSEGAR
ncbi:MAG: lysylphosphatidylglycerol synthase transmembrane domain-containing protein, partial [Actinomycetota bacterium]|nr:lysylphosphatidylglycerol synthase transmembrane domain-containing protein [Actinomycetota bacterium]